jgi:hypothetical protein
VITVAHRQELDDALERTRAAIEHAALRSISCLLSTGQALTESRLTVGLTPATPAHHRAPPMASSANFPGQRVAAEHVRMVRLGPGMFPHTDL